MKRALFVLALFSTPALADQDNIITFAPNINLTVQNAPAPVWGAPAPVAPVPAAPVCRPGVIGNLGIDPWGRLILLNVRVGPNSSFPNVAGPAGEPAVLPPGVAVSVCGQNRNWLQVEVCGPTVCIQGWAFGRYVLPL